MREQFMQILATALANNVGNKLTPELANGIALVVNQGIEQLEQESKTDPKSSQSA